MSSHSHGQIYFIVIDLSVFKCLGLCKKKKKYINKIDTHIINIHIALVDDAYRKSTLPLCTYP